MAETPKGHETGGPPASSLDRRRLRRRKVRIRVMFQRAGAAHFLEAETANFHEEGVFLWTRRRPLDVGTPVALLARADEGDLMLSGTVRWVTPREPYGMGIRFADLDESTRARLAAFLQSLDEEPEPSG